MYENLLRALKAMPKSSKRFSPTNRTPTLRLFARKNSKKCKRVKKFLKKNGIKFREIDVEEEGITPYLWKDLGTDSVPVLAFPGKNVVGSKAIIRIAASVSKNSR